MKLQPKSNLMSRFLPLIGAVIFLVSLPVTAQAQIGPDLKVTKVCVNGPLQSVLCTVTVTNIGTVPSVSPLKLTDVVTGAPADAVFTGGGGTLPISCTPGAGAILPIACSANISLLPNQPKIALFSFKLPTGGSFTNCATVSQAQNAATLPDPNPANNTNVCTTITVPPPSGGPPDLGVKKSCQVFTNSGQPPAATCTVTVANLNSTVPAVLPITLKDTITGPNPAMLTGAGGTLNPSGPGPANVNGVLTTFTGNTPLAGGSSGTMLISYNFPSGGGTYTNCATVSQAQPDSNPANNTNICTTFTVPAPISTACANPSQNFIGCRLTVTVKRSPGPAIYKVVVSPSHTSTTTTSNIAPSNSAQCAINGGPMIPQTTCWFNYNTNPQPVTLTASSSAGPLPTGFFWSGACSGTSPTCTPSPLSVPLINPPIVTANFP